MKSFNIFLLELKKSMSEIKIYIFIYFLAPFLMSLIYGMLYQKIFDPNRTIPKFTIAVVDEDNSVYSKGLNSIFQNENLSKIINLKNEKSSTDVLSELLGGKIAAEIVIPRNFSDDINNGKKTSIKVVKSPSADIQGSIVESIVKAYTDNLNINSAVYASLTKGLNNQAEVQKLSMEIQPEISSILSKSYINEDTLDKTKILSAKQFYSQAMLCMFSLFIILTGASSIIKERENGTLLRIKSTSTGKFNFLMGKLAAVYALSLTQIVCFILLTSIFNGVNWGNSLILSIIILLHSLMITGAAAAVASIFKTHKSMSGLLTIIIMMMCFFGGSFYPTNLYPSFMKTVSRFTLNYWLQQSYSGIMTGSSLLNIKTNLLVILLISVAGFILGSIMFKFDKSEVA